MPAPVVLLLLSLLLGGCLPLRGDVPVAPGRELLVYLHPLGSGADRLRFTLSEVAAVGEDGVLHPLRLLVPSPDPGERGQRLLAVGRLPEKNYRGLAITVERASMVGEEGEAALLVPEEAVLAESAFNLVGEGAALLELAYRPEGSVLDQFRFAPRFFAYPPTRPVVSRMAFASDATGGRILVFDRQSLRVAGVIPVGAGTAGLAIDGRARRGYAAASGEDAILAFDLSSGAPIGRLSLQPGDRPGDLVLTPDGRLLLAACPGADVVSIIDPGTLAEMTRLPVGEDPESILVDRAGRRAYIFNRRANTVTVLDLGRRELLATLATDPGPVRGALNRDGTRLYILHRESLSLSVLDLATLTVRERLPVGMGGSAIFVDSRTDFLYLSFVGDSRIHVYDPLSLQPIDYLPLPDAGGATDLVIDDEENVLLASLAAKVVAFDLVGRRLRGVVEAAPGLVSLGIVGGRP